MDERDASSLRGLRHDLVAEHGSHMGCGQLLDIGSAEAAGKDANELAWALGGRDICEDGEPTRVDHHCAHVAYRRSLTERRVGCP